MPVAKKKAAKRKAPAEKTAASKKAEMKTKPTAQSVTAFINSVENEARRRDAKKILTMMKKITGEKAVMWGPSIIGFGTYHYKYESGREGDMLLVGFSPRKANMVLYVLGSLGDKDPLLAKLGKYKNGRACLYVNKLEDVDENILGKLIAKSYKATATKWGVKTNRA